MRVDLLGLSNQRLKRLITLDFDLYFSQVINRNVLQASIQLRLDVVDEITVFRRLVR